MSKKFLAPLLAVAIAVAPVAAKKVEADLVNGSMSTTLASKYTPNGFGFVQSGVLQNDLYLSKSMGPFTFSADYWTNRILKTNVVNETDYILGLEYTLSPKVSTEFLWGYYAFEDASLESAQDITFRVSYSDTSSGVKASITGADLTDGTGGRYGNALLSKRVDIRKNVALEGQGKIYFNNGFFIDRTGFSACELKTSVPVKINDRLSITPAGKRVQSINRDDFDDHWAGEVTASVNF